MPKRGKRISSAKREEYISDRYKRVFYILLDLITLVSFSLAVYATYFGDYRRTVLYMSIGGLLLIFFIIKKYLKKRKR